MKGQLSELSDRLSIKSNVIYKFITSILKSPEASMRCMKMILIYTTLYTSLIPYLLHTQLFCKNLSFSSILPKEVADVCTALLLLHISFSLLFLFSLFLSTFKKKNSETTHSSEMVCELLITVSIFQKICHFENWKTTPCHLSLY